MLLTASVILALGELVASSGHLGNILTGKDKSRHINKMKINLKTKDNSHSVTLKEEHMITASVLFKVALSGFLLWSAFLLALPGGTFSLNLGPGSPH